MILEIKHRFTNYVLCSFESVDTKDCVQKAVKSGANLRGADLRGADLRGADLYGADLRGEKIAIAPILIGGLIWTICISESYLEIGCQRHTHEKWKNFDDKTINDMESKASEFWKANKSWILSACKAHRKESLAYRKSHPESNDPA